MPDQPDTLTIVLRAPVSLGELTCSQLELREPTAGEMMLWDKLAGTEADIMAVSVVSGVAKPLVEKIGARDLNTAARFIATFLS